MTNIKCYHCKGTHTSIAEVKICSKITVMQIPATAVKTKELVASVAPSAPVKFVPEHRKAKIAVDAAKVQIGTIVEDAPVIVKTGQDLDLGMYQVGEKIFKIKFNKAGTHKYAELLVITTKAKFDYDTNTWQDVPSGKFIYSYGAMATLTSENKMTEEMAKAFHDATKAKYGQDYGFC